MERPNPWIKQAESPTKKKEKKKEEEEEEEKKKKKKKKKKERKKTIALSAVMYGCETRAHGREIKAKIIWKRNT